MTSGTKGTTAIVSLSLKLLHVHSVLRWMFI